MTSTSNAQTITPALRDWIIEQARAGHRPEAVLEAMKSSGWHEDVAIDAMESVLRSMLKTAGPTSPVPEPLPQRVPEPALEGAPLTVWAHDREVRIVMSMNEPRVVVFANLLDDAECDEVVAMASERLERSHTVDTSTGDSEINPARTSDGMFFLRGENAACTRLEARLAALLNWPIENGEGRIFATSRDAVNVWDGLAAGPEVGVYYGTLNFITAGDWALAVQFRRDSTQRLERVDWMQDVRAEREAIP